MNLSLPVALLTALRPVLPRRLRVPLAFDAAGYVSANPDVAAGGGDGLWHFLRHGRTEGRLPCRLQAAELEAAIWAGETGAEDGLLALQQDPGPEGLWARLALARVAAVQGDDWAEADRLLGDPRRLAQMFGLLDPLLFLAEMAFRNGLRPRAEAALRIAFETFGPQFGATLLQAAFHLQDGDSAGWSALVAPLYAAAGLGPPVLRGGSAPAMDRLASDPETSGERHAEGPLVSVVMPARNAALTIDAALASVAAQSWRRIEVLVIDNGSSDATAQRVAHWMARDPRIRLIDGAKAAGAYGARNLGAGLAAGEMITMQDADDWSHPQRIARQVQALQAAPENPATVSHWARVTPDLCPVLWRPDVRAVHPNLSSLMIRRAVIDRIGLWDEVRASADTEYIDRLRSVFGAAAVQEVLPGLPLAFGRIGAGSLTQGATTGLLGPGAAARRAYLTAARDWHARTARPYLPADPRPFQVPAALQIEPEAAP